MLNNTLEEKITERKKFIVDHLTDWSRKNSPEYPWRKTSDPYHIMVSEMLLRRTRASSVIAVYVKFLEKFPDVSHLAKKALSKISKY